MRTEPLSFLLDDQVGADTDAVNHPRLRAARAMLLLAMLALPLFGAVHLLTDPATHDPMWLRFAYAGLCLLLYGCSYGSQWVRVHINVILVSLHYLLTTHFFLLLVLNHLHVTYLIGFFIIQFCIGIIFLTLHSLLYYCGFLTVGVLVVGWLADPQFTQAPLLLGAAVTISIISYATLRFRVKAATALSDANRQLRREMTERVEAEEKLRASEAQHRLFTEHATDILSKQDYKGVLLYVSPACRALLGYAPEEMIGRSAYDFFHPDDVDAIRKAYQDLSQCPDSLTFTYRMRRKNGEHIWIETINQPLRDMNAGRVKEFLSISRDITARREAEQLKDELVSTVSHELRTPLTSLRGFTELMLRKEFSREKQKEFLTIIHSESIRLTNLINDFLDLQRLESGRQQYHFQAFSLPALLQESVTIFSGGKDQGHFHFDLPSHLPAISADQDRIQQVLANLFSNAMKFSPEGSPIIVGAHAQEREVVVWVRDQGVGIPAEALPRLFNKFFRVDNQDTRSIGGTGLGLALIKEIIEGHGGRVWVESAAGKGSTFFFTLPFAQVEQYDLALL